MDGCAYLIFLAIWLLPLLQGLDMWGRACLNLRQVWEMDHEQMYCGRWLALEANLQAGHRLAEREDERAADSLAAAHGDIQELWQARMDEEGFDCRSSASVTLYRQENDRLPQDYPNWWVRFREPGRS